MSFLLPSPLETYPDWEEIADCFQRLGWDDFRPRVTCEAREVFPDIFQITVPQAFYADTNAYLIRGDNPTLIDPGHAYPESIESILMGLESIGFSLSDLAQVVLTHPHVDHAAACVPLQKIHPLPVAAYEGVGKKYSEYCNLMKVAYDLFRPRCPHLLAAGYRPEELAAFARVYYMPPGPIGFRQSLTEGSKIRMGDQNWEVFYTPGHSNEHILLLNPDGLGISGDLIVGRATSLGEISVYLQTLEKLSRLPLKSLLPGHGSLILNPPKRIETAKKTVEGMRKQALELLEGPGLNLLDLTRAVMGDVSKIHLASTSNGLIVSLLDELQSDGLVKAEPGTLGGDPAQIIYRKK
ncbi:MAG: MBL fold metallo-hydrolase [bacterium]|nr:MBL fold metallo-hydrolase [bacterium]